MGRTDDVINVAGHRLLHGRHGGGFVEPSGHCRVCGDRYVDDIEGSASLGFVVLKAGVDRSPDDIINELVQMVRKDIGAVASFKKDCCSQKASENEVRQSVA